MPCDHIHILSNENRQSYMLLKLNRFNLAIWIKIYLALTFFPCPVFEKFRFVLIGHDTMKEFLLWYGLRSTLITIKVEVLWINTPGHKKTRVHDSMTAWASYNGKGLVQELSLRNALVSASECEGIGWTKTGTHKNILSAMLVEPIIYLGSIVKIKSQVWERSIYIWTHLHLNLLKLYEIRLR